MRHGKRSSAPLSLWHVPVDADAPRPPAPTTAPVTLRRTRQQQYDALVIDMKRCHDIRVRKWRTSTTGCAWQVRYADGRVQRLIEAPYPRGPMSAAVFLHEVAHHAIGFNTYSPRCLEEYMAWQWALEAMRRHDLPVTAAIERRVEMSLRYAVAKAVRRGLKRLPAELRRYIDPARLSS